MEQNGGRVKPCVHHIFELLKRIHHVFRLFKMRTVLFQQGVGFSSESAESIILGCPLAGQTTKAQFKVYGSVDAKHFQAGLATEGKG